MATFNRSKELRLYIHNEEHLVKAEDITPDTTLNYYLRKHANLTGVKNMCMEGGCGACIVAVVINDPVTKRDVVMAVNSCLVPIYVCSDWKIYTPETIGDDVKGYHPVQKALVQFNGTQCGYCSSGMVMNMYALYQSGEFTMEEVENAFGGNICRCTGYRSIMSAFKSLAKDASSELLGHISDIEDIPICKKSRTCERKCATPCQTSHLYECGGTKWYKVFSVNEIFDVLKQYPGASYMLVGGNTATGVYKRTKDPDLYISVNSVQTLLNHQLRQDKLILGANITLTNAIKLLNEISLKNEKFSYLSKLADHVDLIANVPVRNTGTLAGNLMIKHEHHEFQSDIYVILETVKATLTIAGTDGKEITTTPHDFLSLDMKRKIITHVTLPALDNSYNFQSYKVMPRAQNAHALVNAGFLLKFDNANKVTEARIVYGAINETFDHAVNSEKYLIGKNLFDNAALQELFQTLDKEINPDHVLPDPTPEFRKQLAIALCYKFILSIAPSEKTSLRNRSGGTTFTRPVSTGTQNYETNESLYPLTKPISKIEALAQSTGTAQYIMDIPDHPGQLHAAFVLAKAPPGYRIKRVDPSPALKLNGVAAFYDKNDIPGENNILPPETIPGMISTAEELFCSSVVKYYYQPLGIVVAETQELADKAAELVDVEYEESQKKPLLTIRDVLNSNETDKISKETSVEPKKKGNDVKKVIKGTFDIYGQYHYTMETQCCVVIPSEDGLDMYPSAQSINIPHVSAAKLLNLPLNKINVSVRRLGGAYGSKITRNTIVSSATALAAYKLKKPVKMQMSLQTNMRVIGKRHPFSVNYETGVNEKGVIQYADISIYSDIGSEGGNENVIGHLMAFFGNFYNKDCWKINAFTTKTDTQNPTWTRSPATTEAISSTENILQHIAVAMDLDPLEVRLNNLGADVGIIKHIDDLKQWAEVEKRQAEVREFNKANRWIKRGLAIVPMLYPQIIFGYWNAHIVIYQADGTVSISHGGVEMGQGINTKVAQACAYSFGIPLEQVNVKPANSQIGANAGPTGGSFTSEAVCLAVLNACDILKKRMEPIKGKLNNPTWLELVQHSYKENVDLSASSLYTAATPGIKMYPIYGVTCCEVEVDLLTGLHQIRRVDILEDTGQALSPQIDIGQVEGAFVMGMGYWTSEQIVYNERGQIVTDNTWTYKPPGAKDIPIDFRVKFPKSQNQTGVFGSKANAEPPLCMTVVVAFAIKDAVANARKEADPNAERWYPINGPASVENTFLNSLPNFKQYLL